MIGRVLGRYRATDAKLARDVALKGRVGKRIHCGDTCLNPRPGF